MAASPLLTALVFLLFSGAVAEPAASLSLQGGRPCDPFSEQPGVQCEASSTHLVQKNAAKLIHEASANSSGAAAAEPLQPKPLPATSGRAAVCRDRHVLQGLAPSECPQDGDLPACDTVAVGALCEGDGECGTNDLLNNCGGVWDVYRKTVSLGQIWREDNTTKKAGSKGTEYSLMKAPIGKAQHDEILKRNGQFLGLSRDCWIVAGMIVFSLLFCFVVIITSVSCATSWRGELIGHEIEYEEDNKTIKEPSFPVGFLQRVVFRADLNDSFAYRADLATRTALACAFMALTYWVPCLAVLNEKGWTMQYVVVIIAFTVFMDLGQTVSLAWANFYGTILPTLNIICLYNYFEHGVALQPGQEEGDTLFTSCWWVGVLDFIFFNAAFLVLKVPVGVRMFALSWQAYFSMCFLNPTTETRFSRGLDDIILEGQAVGPLVGTIFGCVISVLIMVASPVGYCFSGLGQAQESAIGLAWNMGEEWQRMIEYYTGCDRSLEIDKIIGEARLLQQQLNTLGSQLSCTWWETFDIGRTGRVKAHLEALKVKFEFMNDWFSGVVEAIKKEKFDKEHEQLMEKVKKPLEDLANHNARLLYRVTQAALSGFSPSRASSSEAATARALSEQLKLEIAAVNGAQRELASTFVAARREVYGKDTLTEDALSEHFFGFALSSMATYTVEYAEYLISDAVASRETVGPFKASWQGFISTLKMNGTDFILRNSLAFFGAWVIGYGGIEGMMSPFSSTAAGTTAYLMAAEGKGGSALLKNVARFQGTAGGTIIGQLLYTTFITCSVIGSIAGFVVITIFEFFAMYLYLSSPMYGYVGLLLAAYGATHLVLACDSAADSSAAVYTTIIDQTMAIICVTVADLIVQNKSAGTLAADSYMETSKTLVKALSTLFGVDELITSVGFGMDDDFNSWMKSGGAGMLLNLKRLGGGGKGTSKEDYVKALTHRDSLYSSHSTAADMGVEAPLEPRFFRLPFKDDLWKAVMRIMGHMSTQTVIMEYAVHDCASGGNDPGHTMKAINKSEILQKKATQIVKRAHTILQVSEKILKRESLAPLDVDSDMIRRINNMDSLTMDDQMKNIVEEIVKDLPLPTEYSVDSLVHEDYCLVSVVLMMINAIVHGINKVEEHCFATPDIELIEE